VARERVRVHREQRACPPGRQAQPDGAGRERQERALGELLPHYATPAGAQRGAQRELPLPHLAAHEEEVGRVRARDEQHQPHDAGEHEERLADVADERVVQRHRADREAPVRRRSSPGAPAGAARERLELRARLRWVTPGEPRDGEVVVRAARARVDRGRGPVARTARPRRR
jgi:hypothetical protein